MPNFPRARVYYLTHRIELVSIYKMVELKNFKILKVWTEVSFTAIVQYVSDIKQGEKIEYYKGFLSDGEISVPFIAFGTRLYPKMDRSARFKKTRRFHLVKIRPDKYSDGELQFAINDGTQIEDSEIKIPFLARAEEITSIEDILEQKWSDGQLVSLPFSIKKWVGEREVECKNEKKKKLNEYLVEDEEKEILLVVWGKRERQLVLRPQAQVVGRYVKVKNVGGEFSLETDVISSVR